MSKQPAFLFYPNDWNRDLEEHSLEIQGAWIVLLTKLWWSNTRGAATKTLEEWARILREKNKKTEKILQYLYEKEIADITGLDNQTGNHSITITSRRMVKDFKISQLRQRVGKLGGNPILVKKEDNLDNKKPNQKALLPIPIPIPKKEKKERKAGLLDEEQAIDILQHHIELVKPFGLYTTIVLDNNKKKKAWLKKYQPMLEGCAQEIKKLYPDRNLLETLKESSKHKATSEFFISNKLLSIENAFRKTKICEQLEKYWASCSPSHSQVSEAAILKHPEDSDD